MSDNVEENKLDNLDDLISSQFGKGLKIEDSFEKEEEESAGSEEIVINPEEESCDEDEYVDPDIPLPPLIEILEEQETVVVEYRAKLFRFDEEGKEWKEKATGDVKLLQSKEDPGVCRVVMWTQISGKVACNFRLFPEFRVDFFQNNLKRLCWKCFDFSEEDPSWTTFTCKFGSEDNCQDFKKKVEECSKLVPISAEEEGCTGCDGCNPDEAVIPNVVNVEINERVIDIPLASDSSTGLPFVISITDLC